MKKVTYQLSIPNPCHEDWDKMIPEERGRFCLSCQKTVIDFTRFSDEEIVELLAANTNLCGHVALSQMNRPITANLYTPKITSWWQAALFAMFSLFSSKILAVPGGKAMQINEQPYKNKHKIPLDEMKGPDVHRPDTGNIVLKGMVMDSATGLPIISAQVLIYQHGNRIATSFSDSEGKFMIEIKHTDSAVLVCNAIGYEKFRLTDIHHSDEDMEIRLLPGVVVKGNRDMTIDGSISSGGMIISVERRNSIWDSILYKLRSDE